MSTGDPLYDADHIAFLEALWGHGYLSPGGPQEVRELLRGMSVAGAEVLDIGSGSGGITASLAAEHGAATVVGIDVEAPVCAAARRLVDRAGLHERVEIRLVEPGPLPFEEHAFDVVFSKDAIVHIADKHELARQIHRVLRPGGWFVASDWLISHDGEPSAEMQRYLELEDLDFGMASPSTYADALEEAGFVDIELRNRNEWYQHEAARELDRLRGPDHRRFVDAVGSEEVEAQIRTWEAMLVVLGTGEHCPHHIRARRP